MKKARKKRTKRQSKISKIISSDRSDYSKINSYLNDLDFQEIIKNVKVITDNLAINNAIYLTLSNESNIYKPKIPNVSFEKNIAWCLGLIIFHKDKIQQAIDMEDELFKSITEKNYSKCDYILNKIDDLCGVSIYSASIRSAIKNRSGSNDIKNYAEIFKLKEHSFVEYVVSHACDYYSEHDIFDTSIRTDLLDIERAAHPDIRDFLLYRIYGYNLCSQNLNAFENIFKIERNSSILDIFYLVVNFICYIFTNESYNGNHSYPIKHLLSDLKRNLKFSFLGNAFDFHHIDRDFYLDKNSLDIIDYYTLGDYDKVCNIANTFCLNNFDFSIFEAIVKSNIRCGLLNKNDPLYYIVPHMENIYIKNDSFHASLQFLSCESYAFRNINWFKQLSLFVLRESPNTSDFEKEKFDLNISILSKTDTPKRSKLLGLYESELFLNRIKSSYSESISVEFYKSIVGLKNSVDILLLNVEKDRKNKYYAQKLLSDENYFDAIKVLTELVESKDEIIAIESSKLLVNTYILSKNYKKAIELFVNKVLDNKNYLSVIDSNKLLMSSEGYIKENSSIDILISYSLHSRYINSFFDSNLRYSFEKFMSDEGFIFPTELFGMEEKYNDIKLKYFLKYICTPDVMKLYFYFDSIRHTEDCRLKICKYLMEQGDESEFLRNEVKDINRAHIVRKATKKIENSRIYVDTSSFTGRESDKFRGLFQRFSELSNKDYSETADEGTFSELLEHLKSASLFDEVERWKGLSILHVPEIKLNPKNATFLSLLKLIRHEFTFGDKGLNNYLSTRIRHGVLPTAMRKPLVEENLYISESARIDSFRAIEPYEQYNIKDIDILWKHLRVFSDSFEGIIYELNDQRIQVTNLEDRLYDINGNPIDKKAMFDYSISPLESYAVQKELSISPSYLDFVKVSTQWLWNKTDYNLKQLQNYILKEFKAEGSELYESLKTAIVNDISNPRLIDELCNSIDRSRDKFFNQLNIICSWFEHVDLEDKEEYELETSIDIAKRSLNVDVKVERNVNCAVSEKTLSYMVDLFFILFENALSKSKLDKGNLAINVTIDKNEDGCIELKASNNTMPDKPVDELNQNLEFYREAYGDELLIKDVLQKEGGTGLFKIWKILEKDLEIKHNMKVYFSGDSTFNVEFVLNHNASIRVK